MMQSLRERRKGGEEKKKEERRKYNNKKKPASRQETISQRSILLACPKFRKAFLKGLQELPSSPHCRQDWKQGVPDPSGPGGLEAHPSNAPPRLQPRQEKHPKQTDNLKNQTKLSSPYVFIKTRIKTNTGDSS